MAIRNNSIFFLALKYMRARSRFVIGSSHIFTLVGITIGVLALISVSSVMNGFREDISKRIIGTLSEMRLSSVDKNPMENHEALSQKIEQQGYQASGVVRTEALLRSLNAAAPALCFGIDPSQHKEVSPVLSPQKGDQGIIAGSLEPMLFAEGGIVLGSGLANQLGVYLNDEIMMVSPVFNIPTAFGLLPRIQRLKVIGIFVAGMPEYDQNYCFIPLPIAQSFNGYGNQVDYIEIRSGQANKSKQHVRALQPLFPGYKLEDWSSFDASLYGAIRFEKYLMFTILLFMFVIASFNLTGSMLKIISQKKRELGLLKAIGYQDKDLRKLFGYQAMMICTGGIVLGLVISVLILSIQSHTGLIRLEGDIILPVKIQVADCVAVIILSYILTFLSILLPLRRLKEINPVALIRRMV